MVSGRGLALNATDRLLAGYVAFITVVIIARGPLDDGRPWLLAAHGLFGLLLWGFTRLDWTRGWVRGIHIFYPLVLLPLFYAEIGALNSSVGLTRILEHDATVQSWEAALFGDQVSFTWMRNHPSTFWSGILHGAYLAYYPIILLTAPALALRGHWLGAARVIFAMMLAFVMCYVVFVLYPVAGPNYAFPHPTGAVRDVWTARVVYGVLAAGSSVGAAFPSSHVAATLAVTMAAWRAWRPLGGALILPFVLLTVGTVYCQMHYAIDALGGLVLGVLAVYLCRWLWPSDAVESDRASSANEPRTSRM